MNMVEQVTDYVKNYDEEVGKAIELELGRQRRNLELIASENIISPAVTLRIFPYSVTILQYIIREEVL